MIQTTSHFMQHFAYVWKPTVSLSVPISLLYNYTTFSIQLRNRLDVLGTSTKEKEQLVFRPEELIRATALIGTSQPAESTQSILNEPTYNTVLKLQRPQEVTKRLPPLEIRSRCVIPAFDSNQSDHSPLRVGLFGVPMGFVPKLMTTAGVFSCETSSRRLVPLICVKTKRSSTWIWITLHFLICACFINDKGRRRTYIVRLSLWQKSARNHSKGVWP